MNSFALRAESLAHHLLRGQLWVDIFAREEGLCSTARTCVLARFERVEAESFVEASRGVVVALDVQQ